MEEPFRAFQVQLIPDDMSITNTIMQIATSLQFLDDVSSEIFGKTQARIARYTDAVKDLKTRTHHIRGKLARMRATTSAIVIKSTCKYPAKQCHREYVSIFDGSNPLQLDVLLLSDQLRTHHQRDKQMYPVQVPRETDQTKALTKTLKSVVEYFYFDQCTSPYRRRTETTNQSMKYKKKTPLNSEQTIAEAPKSFTDRGDVTISNYSYLPSLGAVPLLQVPLDLPCLSGIADDLRYTLDTNDMISPSSLIPVQIVNTDNTASTNDLKQTELPDNATIPNLPPSSVAIPSVASSFIAIVSADNQIPDAVMLNLPDIDESDDVNVDVEESLGGFVPSPPPLPAFTSETKESKPQQSSQSGAVDAHAALMQAIRNVDRNKLKKSDNERVVVQADEKKPTNLMDELYANLALRRKGISGDKSMLARVSSMIPVANDSGSSDADSSDAGSWNDD